MKGDTGGEKVLFELEGDAPSKSVKLGPVYAYLPSGLTTDWQQVVIEISPEVATKLPQASSLRVRLYEGKAVAVRLKELSVLPRLPDSDGWNRAVVRLADYGQSTLAGVASLALDYYQGQGTRLAKLETKEIRGGTRQDDPAREAPRRTPAFALATAGPGGPGAFQPVRFATFEQAPSSVRLKTPPKARGREARAVRLDYRKRGGGFCGFRMELTDLDNNGRTSTYFTTDKRGQTDRRTDKVGRTSAYFDATPYRFLSFWVRGGKGREDLTVKLADARWAEKQDSVPLATVSDILHRDIGKKWQEVLIPLEPARFRQLDFTRLATLAFNFSRPGSGTVYLADVAFLTARETPAAGGDSSPGGRATWIWDAAPILAEEPRRQELFKLARARGIGVLYLQIDAGCKGSGEGVECQLNNEEALRPFLRQARARGLEVHALDGAPNYSLPAWQPTALARLGAVLDYNRRVAPEQRFAGFHHDNEPYLLDAFAGVGGEPLLVNLLELTEASQQLVRQVPERIVYGVDIPFWYDSRPVTWKGVRNAASLHLLDLVDTAAVMAYRTEAAGADGVLALAEDEIRYAGRLGKRVFVALETAPLPDQAQYTFALGGPTAETPVNQGAYLLAEEWPGVAILYWKDFALEGGGGSSRAAERLVTEPFDSAPLDHARGKQDRPGPYRVFRAVRRKEIPGSRLSFAATSDKTLKSVIKQVEAGFKGEAGFAGMALHHYESYRQLTRR